MPCPARLAPDLTGVCDVTLPKIGRIKPFVTSLSHQHRLRPLAREPFGRDAHRRKEERAVGKYTLRIRDPRLDQILQALPAGQRNALIERALRAHFLPGGLADLVERLDRVISDKAFMDRPTEPQPHSPDRAFTPSATPAVADGMHMALGKMFVNDSDD